MDDGTWYFLSPRYRRYEGGGRPARRTDDDRGRWKPSTGQSSKPPEVEAEDASTSRRRRAAFSENTLAYYVGPTKGETKTKWLMQELVVPETPGNGFHFHGNITAAAATDDDETPDDNHDMLVSSRPARRSNSMVSFCCFGMSSFSNTNSSLVVHTVAV